MNQVRGLVPFLLGLLGLIVGGTACTPRYTKPTFKTHGTKGGVVVCAHPEAAKAGMTILDAGGNAIDAAVATAYALAVCRPEAGNLGGGGFMIIHVPGRDPVALDFREMAPRAAHRDLYLDEKGNVVPGLSLYSHKAVGVPGTVRGHALALKTYGSLPLQIILAPAIKLAEEGFTVTNRLYENMRKLNAHLEPYSYSRSVLYGRKKRLPKVGETWKQPDLAMTLRLLADKGSESFYFGFLAQLFVAEMDQGGGLITFADLKAYKPKIRVPTHIRWKGYDLYSMPPPSSGGIAIAQILKLLEPYELEKLGHNSVESIHRIVEAERLAYADRATHLGDPDFFNVPQVRLVSKAYIDFRRTHINLNRATPSASITAGAPHKEGTNTTHLSVIDKDGMAVSLTTTLNTSFGSRVAVREAGFFLNNEMDDFSAKPGVPNAYGLIGGEANAIAPGKRPLSSMSPTIVLKNSKPVLIVGSPGGSTIITTVLQIILNNLEFGLKPVDSVQSARFHHQWHPDRIQVERGGFSPELIDSLEEKGHTVADRTDSSGKPDTLGNVQAIFVQEKTGLRLGVTDQRRGDGTAIMQGNIE